MFGRVFGKHAAEKENINLQKKHQKELEKARAANGKEISALLSGDPHAGEIKNALHIGVEYISHSSGAKIRKEKDGTWFLERYHNIIENRRDMESGLTREEAIRKLIAFVRDWHRGIYPEGSRMALQEQYKDDAIGLGKLLFESTETIRIPEHVTPDHLHVHTEAVGSHDENEIWIDLIADDGHIVQSWSYREPTEFVLSGRKITESGLAVAYLCSALNIPVK